MPTIPCIGISRASGGYLLNELAKGPLPDYRALNARYGERFQPQDMNSLQPLPSGLFGTVRLVTR